MKSMNLGTLLVFCLFKFTLIYGQISSIVRENAYVFDGRTIWNIANRDPTIWSAGVDITQAGVAQRLDAASKNDKAVAFDNNRTLIFSMDVPKVVEDRDAQWVSLPNGDLGYFYVNFGNRSLSLQIYNSKGEPKSSPLAFDNVLCYSAISSSQPVNGKSYVAVVTVDNQSGNAVKLMVLNSDGSKVADPYPIPASFDTSVTALPPKIFITTAADGSFLLAWPDKTRDNVKAIRAAYYKPGQLVSKPFIAATASSNNIAFMSITKCESMKIGEGYYCLYDEATVSGATFSRIPFVSVFSYSGSVYRPPNPLTKTAATVTGSKFQGTVGTGLPYGGLLLASNTSTQLFNNQWAAQTFAAPNGFALTNPIVVLPNNTVITVAQNTQAQAGDWVIFNGFKANVVDAPKFSNESRYDNNPAILNTLPTLGGNVAINAASIRISFSGDTFRNGLGNVSIYDANYPQSPRQFITIIPGTTSMGLTYTIPVSRYAFNSPSTKYYVTVDGGAFQSNIEEPLAGIKQGVWSFKTPDATEGNEKSDIVVQIRVVKSAAIPNDNDDISKQLSSELTTILPIESNRISVRHLRSDGSDADIFQVSLKKLRGNGKQTAANLALDLQAMMRDTTSSGLLLGSTTQAIDMSYGAVIEENVFTTNKWALVGILCGIIVVIIAYVVMCRRFPDSDNLLLIILAISLFDFFSDLFFIIMNSGDVPSLRVPSIIFFIVPFAFNMVASTGIIVKEVSTNPSFHEWFSRRTLVTSAVSVLSATNPYLLNLLRSKFAGISDLDAPMSENVSKWILLCTAVDIIVEDIPQLVIQAMYKTHNGYFKLAPFLSLVSSCLGIVLSIISHVYSHLAQRKGPKNIARKGTDFSGSHFQINDTIERKNSVQR